MSFGKVMFHITVGAWLLVLILGLAGEFPNTTYVDALFISAILAFAAFMAGYKWER